MNESCWSIIIAALQFGVSALIFWANNRSVKAANNQINAIDEQVKESKRQFEETQRLQVMPYLQVKIDSYKQNGRRKSQGLSDEIIISESEAENEVKAVKCFTLKNIGMGTLHETKAKWISMNGNEYPVTLAMGRVIPPNDVWEFDVEFKAKKPNPDDSLDYKSPDCKLHIEYKDLNGKKYFQDFYPVISISEFVIDPYYFFSTPPKPVDNSLSNPSATDHS